MRLVPGTNHTGSTGTPNAKRSSIPVNNRYDTSTQKRENNTSVMWHSTRGTGVWSCPHLSSPSVMTTAAAPKLCASMLTKPVPAPSSNTVFPFRSSFSAPDLAQA